MVIELCVNGYLARITGTKSKIKGNTCHFKG